MTSDELNKVTKQALRRVNAREVVLSYSGRFWTARALPTDAAVAGELARTKVESLAEIAAEREKIARRAIATAEGKTAIEAVEALEL